MKKIMLILGMGILITSCNVLPRPISYLGIIDYSPLIQNGIYVTESNSVNFDYTAIGSIASDDIGGFIDGDFIYPDIDTIFSKIGKTVKEIGANGIINLKIDFSKYYDKSIKIDLPRITINAMAIKIDSDKLSAVKDENYLGEIDGIKCKIIEKSNNGMRIFTTKKLNIDQIKRASKEFHLDKNIVQFYLTEQIEHNNAYIGITDGNIIIYETNEFIPLE